MSAYQADVHPIELPRSASVAVHARLKDHELHNTKVLFPASLLKLSCVCVCVCVCVLLQG